MTRTFIHSFGQVVPAHYPCGAQQAGQDLEVSPNIGLANAMPDDVATADFKIRGRDLYFTGVGYHDKVRRAFPRKQRGSAEQADTHDRTRVSSLSSRTCKAGTGAMAASDRTRSCGSTFSLIRGESTSADMWRNGERTFKRHVRG